MPSIEILINRCFPKASKEEMEICLLKVFLESDKESKRKADKETWMLLMEKVFDSGLFAEFCEFYLENPELNMSELYHQFCNEWDL
jgi:hypothetical protein